MCLLYVFLETYIYLTPPLPRRQEPESRRNGKKERSRAFFKRSGTPLHLQRPAPPSSSLSSGRLTELRVPSTVPVYYRFTFQRHTSVAALKPASMMRSGLQSLPLNWKTEPSRKSPVTPLKCNIVRFSFRLS